MPWGSRDYKDAGDESDERDDMPTASQQWQAASELEGFDLRTSDVDGYGGDDDNNLDVDKVEEALSADDGSTQNVEDWGHSTGECEDWKRYIWPVKYEIGEANSKARDVSEAKTVLYYMTTSQSETYMWKVHHPI